MDVSELVEKGLKRGFSPFVDGRLVVGCWWVVCSLVFVLVEPEQIKQIADGRHVEWNVRVLRVHDGIGEVVAAAVGERLEPPVTLDELHDRSMVGVGVADVAAAGKGRDDDQRDARTVTEEVERLEETRVPIAAAFVEGDEDGGLAQRAGWPSTHPLGLTKATAGSVPFAMSW
jgi:hypothetical protein